jgi:hypothetical protein
MDCKYSLAQNGHSANCESFLRCLVKTFLLLALGLISAPVSLFGLQLVGPTVAQTEVPRSPTLADIDIVRNRYVLSVLPVDSSAVEYLRADSARYAAALQPDGSWSDINYADVNRSVWTTTDHLERILAMAKLARLDRNQDRPDDALEGKIRLGLKWWTIHDYQNPNWWWNQIGVPLLMGETGNLMGQRLSNEDVSNIVAIMKRSDWRSGKWTGANLTW